METKEQLLDELLTLSEECAYDQYYPTVGKSTEYLNGVCEGVNRALEIAKKLEIKGLVEIPLAVAKWIEAFKREFDDVWVAMSYIEKFYYGTDIIDYGVYSWYIENKDDFARAWLNGYTLAKLYTVELSDDAYLKRNGMIVLGTGDDTQPDKLTKSQIMKINPNYWAFRKEVED